MGIVIVLIVLALIFGGLGFLIEGLLWLLVIAVVLLVVGAVAGSRVRSGR
ncbi:hypothetical protein BH24ACT2_BH24ACT2_18980 [soil metagenome]|nr:hypothetical protein [Acidimicrobiia bacterium]MBA3956557.1 hypothetical protein [Acidimicrobiia bacterium]